MMLARTVFIIFMQNKPQKFLHMDQSQENTISETHMFYTLNNFKFGDYYWLHLDIKDTTVYFIPSHMPKHWQRGSVKYVSL